MRPEKDLRVRSRGRPGPPDRPALQGLRGHPDRKDLPARQGEAEAAEEPDLKARRASRVRPDRRENLDLRDPRATTGLPIL